jgi:hypothetical protein
MSNAIIDRLNAGIKEETASILLIQDIRGWTFHMNERFESGGEANWVIGPFPTQEQAEANAKDNGLESWKVFRPC